ncbi:hypothetical protein [Isoptericola aurantiacus]|uniref:hypothetical protein n=1 Tax=Isoptericola aurantiacus TaxID=3377839 RepID=UPI00383A6D67
MSATLADARLTFGHAVRAEALKLTTVRGMWWVAVASIALSLMMVATSSRALPEPGNELDWTMASIASAIVTAWVIVSVFAALQATGEWTSGMYRVSFAVVPRRSLWLAAKATVLGIYAGVVSIVVVAASTAIMLARHGSDGAVVDLGAARTWEVFLGVPAVCIATAVMAVGIGALVRSSGVAVTVVVALLVVLPFAGMFGLDWLAHLTSYLPSGAGDSIVRSGAFGVTADDLGVVLGSVVMLAWAAGACLLAAFAMNRRDA